MWTARAIAANQEPNAVFRENVPVKGWTAGSPTRWSPESFAREQYPRGGAPGSYLLEPPCQYEDRWSLALLSRELTAGLCLQVDQTFSEERLKDVALATDAKFPADACTLPLKQLANQVQRHLWLPRQELQQKNQNSEPLALLSLPTFAAQFQYSIVPQNSGDCDSAAAIETAQILRRCGPGDQGAPY